MTFKKNHSHLFKFLLFGSPILNLLSTKINYLHLEEFFPHIAAPLTPPPGAAAPLPALATSLSQTSPQHQAGRQRVLIIRLLHLLFLPCRPNMTICSSIFRQWTSLINKTVMKLGFIVYLFIMCLKSMFTTHPHYLHLSLWENSP